MQWSLFTSCFYLEGTFFADGKKEKGNKKAKKRNKKLNYCFQGAAWDQICLNNNPPYINKKQNQNPLKFFLVPTVLAKSHFRAVILHEVLPVRILLLQDSTKYKAICDPNIVLLCNTDILHTGLKIKWKRNLIFWRLLRHLTSSHHLLPAFFSEYFEGCKTETQKNIAAVQGGRIKTSFARNMKNNVT